MDREQQQDQQHQLQQPLTNRSTNTHLSSTSTSTSCGDEKKTMSSSFKQNENENGFLRPGEGNGNQAHYVSPSDGIMSPCTKKLSDLKGKRFRSAGKPQTLFAKTIQMRSAEKMGAVGGEKPAPSSSLKEEERNEDV